uniref:Uncharacterized protein n=1 Tax=Arundo donax TaxID=35708 RepID=A0A0A9AP70_ARUDO
MFTFGSCGFVCRKIHFPFKFALLQSFVSSL